MATIFFIPASAQGPAAGPFDVVRPLEERYRAVPFGAVRPAGWLREHLRRNLDGFTGHLDSLAPDLLVQDDIYGRDRLTKKAKNKNLGALSDAGAWQEQFMWWNSETQGNWLDGYFRTAILLRDPAHLKKAESLVRRLLATQDADGYLGIYDPEMRYRFNDENGELWSKATLCRALLGWYEYKKDKAVLAAVEKAVDNVLRNYPAGQSHPFGSSNPNAGGLTHGLAFTDVLEKLYALTNRGVYRDYCLFLYKDFSEQTLAEDAQYPKLIQTDLPLAGHGVHTCEHLRSVAAAYYASGNPALKKALQGFLTKIGKILTPSGAPAGDEFIGGRTGDATETGYEYCSLHELLAGWTGLLAKTGSPLYGDQAERLFFNAALGATHPRESAICYLKTDNALILTGGKHGDTTDRHQTRYRYSPVHREAAVCCVPNAGRIGPCYLQHMWMQDKLGLCATLLGPCELSATVKGARVHIREVTEYPYDQTVRFEVSAEKPTVFNLRIRKPAWAVSVKSSLPFVEEEGFLVVKRAWGKRDVLTLAFGAEPVQKATPDGSVYFTLGPLVLCRPVEGAQTVTKEFGVAGLRESVYRPVDAALYEYAGAPVWTEKDKAFPCSVELIQPAMGKTARVPLAPMGKTILRQVTFRKWQGG